MNKLYEQFINRNVPKVDSLCDMDVEILREETLEIKNEMIAELREDIISEIKKLVRRFPEFGSKYAELKSNFELFNYFVWALSVCNVTVALAILAERVRFEKIILKSFS